VRESTHIHTYICIWKAKGGGIRSFSFFILCSARGRALDAGVVFRGAFWRHLSEQSLTPAAAQTPATTTSRSPVVKLNLLLSWRQTRKRRARACRRWRKAQLGIAARFELITALRVDFFYNVAKEFVSFELFTNSYF
jgi:hypothetical protein